MTSSLRMLGLTIFLIGLSGLPAFGQGTTRLQLPTDRTLGRYGLELAWTANAAINPSRDTVESIVVDEQTVFIQTKNGFITAIDAETGERRWSQLPARLDTPSFPVVTNDNVMLVSAGMELVAFNKWTGGQLWRMPLPEQPTSPPALDNERVYIAGQRGSIYSYDMPKIQQLYHEGKLPQWDQNALVWRHKTSAAVSYSPVLIAWNDESENDREITEVIFASQTRVTYAIGASNHKLGFQVETQEAASAPLGWVDDYVFLATDDQHVYCIDVPNRSFVWEFASRSPVRTALRVVEGRLYISPTGGTLFCIEARTGRELWKEDQARTFLAQIGSKIIANDDLGNLLVLDPGEASGDLLSSFAEVEISGRLPLKQFSIRGQNELTDRLFLCTPAGVVIAIRQQGSEFPRYFKRPNSRPIEPLLADPAQAAAGAPVDDNN